MYFLTYVSQATRTLTKPELDDILELARNKNKARNVTGLLLFRANNFFQLLEGNKADVTEIFDVISKDERHTKVEVLFQNEIEAAKRILPQWQMGLVDTPLADAEQEEMMQELHKVAVSELPNRERILELLKKFSKHAAAA